MSDGWPAHRGKDTWAEQVPSSTHRCTVTYPGRWELPAVFKPSEAGARSSECKSALTVLLATLMDLTLIDATLREPAHCSLWLSVVVIVTRFHCLIPPLRDKGLKLTGDGKPVANCMHRGHPKIALPAPVWPPNVLESRKGPVSSTRVNDFDFLSCGPFHLLIPSPKLSDSHNQNCYYPSSNMTSQITQASGGSR